MAVNPRTIARLEARILERAAYCIEFEMNDPRRTFITLTRVELANDLSTALVHYSVLGDDVDKSKAKHMLEGASGFVQGQVARVLQTRRVPKISWRYDDSVEFAAEMDRKIKSAMRRDQGINPEAHSELPSEEEEARAAERMAELEYEQFVDENEDNDEGETSTS